MIELWIEGTVVDIYPDTKITLNFKSNIFGDISKIEASNSYTIALPKTPTNNKIFGSPAVIGNSTKLPYRRWNAQLYINGVSVVDTAYAIMLSVGSSYEIALYWGVITSLSSFKDSDKTIADLNSVLYTQYGGGNWWENWEAAPGTDNEGSQDFSLINAVYEAGIEDLRNNTIARKRAALLPSVRAKWIWDNIVSENELTVQTPISFSNWLNQIVLPFTTHKVNKTIEEICKFLKVNYRTTSVNGPYLCKATFHTLRTTPAVNPYGVFEQKVVSLKMNNRSVDFDAVIYRARQAHTATFTLMLTVEKSYEIGDYRVGFELYNSEGTPKYTNLGYENSIAEQIETTTTFKLSEGDYVVATAEAAFKDITILSSTMLVDVTESEENQVMGGYISTRDNLPKIKQLDFVKAMCAMYGLWATIVDGVVHLVSYDDCYNDAQPTLDWSHKLIGTGDGEAAKTTFSLKDFAQRNNLRYKEDDTVSIDADGALLVDNDNIDKEKDMFTLPFAASLDNIIPHLKWKNDDSASGEIEEQKVEPRIMFLQEGMSVNNTNIASLSFDAMDWQTIILSRYNNWQKIMRNPITIEEKMWLSEIDIKQLDFRKPIYLQKYGARFVIDNVQWSEGEPSTVTLVKLPPAKQIGVALPYAVTTGVTFGSSITGTAVEPTPAWAHLVQGAGEYFAESATLYFDEATAKSQHGIGFVSWTTEAGVVLSTDNPFVYDGSNGGMTIYANTADTLS